MSEPRSPEGVVINLDFNHLGKDELLNITHKLVVLIAVRAELAPEQHYIITMF